MIIQVLSCLKYVEFEKTVLKYYFDSEICDFEEWKINLFKWGWEYLPLICYT